MSYASLMVYVDADGTPERRVRLCAGLADKFNATLIGISAALWSPMMVERVAIQGTQDAEIKALKKKLAEKEQWFRQSGGAGRQNLTWRTALDFPATALGREARSTDLVVIGRSAGSGDPYISLDPGDVLLRLGRPALVVPDEVSSLLAENVVIGWKETSARHGEQWLMRFLFCMRQQA